MLFLHVHHVSLLSFSDMQINFMVSIEFSGAGSGSLPLALNFGKARQIGSTTDCYFVDHHLGNC